MKNIGGVSYIAADIQSTDLEDSYSLDKIYTRYNSEEDELDEDSLVEEFTLRIKPVEMNEVSDY